MKPLLLRLHRWMTLVFALPLVVVIATGLILSFEPIAQDLGSRGRSLSAEKLRALVDRHDPEGKARGLALAPYENRMTLTGAGPNGRIDIDLATGDLAAPGQSARFSDVIGMARGLHEHFLFDLEWVVTASTVAMLVLIGLGVAMGWPRLRQSVSGWHQGIAWFGLPVLALSPITGLMLAFGVSLTSLPPQDRAAVPPLRDAVSILGQGADGQPRDLGGLVWLRNRGGRLLARVNEGGIFNVYQVSRRGAVLTATNWPRGLHEGSIAGAWSGTLVLVTALGLFALLVTGLTMYARRLLRRRPAARRAAIADLAR